MSMFLNLGRLSNSSMIARLSTINCRMITIMRGSIEISGKLDILPC